MELDFNFAHGGKVRIKPCLGALAPSRRLDLGDLPVHLGSHWDHDVIKCIDWLHNPPVDCLTSLLHTDFGIERDLQRRTLRNSKHHGLRRWRLDLFLPCWLSLIA